MRDILIYISGILSGASIIGFCNLTQDIGVLSLAIIPAALTLLLASQEEK